MKSLDKFLNTGKRPRHDKIYRLKNLSIAEICNKYPDCVSDVWSENDKPVIELEHVRIKYINADKALLSSYNIK